MTYRMTLDLRAEGRRDAIMDLALQRQLRKEVAKQQVDSGCDEFQRQVQVAAGGGEWVLSQARLFVEAEQPLQPLP